VDLLYFAILCSVLIFVHELGHFAWAKIFGVKVLTFSIGFGPRVLRLRGRETEYCVGLLPLGGFVKLLEDTADTPVLPEDRKRTFQAQPLYKRLVIVLAGPAMNIAFPVLLYTGVFLGDHGFSPPTIGVVLPGHPAEGKLLPGDRVLRVDGEDIGTFAELHRAIARSPKRQVELRIFRENGQLDLTLVPEEKLVRRPLDIVERVGEIGVRPFRSAAVVGVARADSPAFRAGLRTFDLITEVRGQAIKSFADLERALRENRGSTVPVTYLRPTPGSGSLGGLAELSLFEAGVAALTPDPGLGALETRTGLEDADLYVAEVPEGSPEWAAGLRAGDRILAIDGLELAAWSQLRERLAAAPDQPHALTWLHGGQRKEGMLRLGQEEYVDEYGKKQPRSAMRLSNWVPSVPEPEVQPASPLTWAFRSALSETYEVIRFLGVSATRIAQGRLSLSTLGGPISVYDMIGTEGAKGVSYFVWAMAVISINLGLVNLLPVPMLDGGQLLFLGCEALLRRPLSLRARERASLAGLALLIALMGLGFKNDVERRWDVIRAQAKELLG
jgi:regulator of sigma E protease